jgi:hypothetical protein
MFCTIAMGLTGPLANSLQVDKVEAYKNIQVVEFVQIRIICLSSQEKSWFPFLCGTNFQMLDKLLVPIFIKLVAI